MKNVDFKKQWWYNYLLGLWALVGYWVATIPGLTGDNGWAFSQPLYILIPVLTLWYGTWFLLFDIILKKVVFK